MQNARFAKILIPFFAAFVLINSILLIWEQHFINVKIDPWVVFVANCLLLAISTLNLAMHIKSVNNKNPNVAIRSVMLATLLKLFILVGAALIYLFLAGKDRSTYAILVSMVLYIIYTVMEVRIASKINQDNDAER